MHIKKGGVDLSEFHATQGRRIVDIRDTFQECARFRHLKKKLKFSSSG
jgi:hypothetical protein